MLIIPLTGLLNNVYDGRMRVVVPAYGLTVTVRPLLPRVARGRQGGLTR